MADHDKKASIESLVAELNENGKRIPVQLSDMTDFPYSTYTDLLLALKNGEAAILRLSVHVESTIFSMVASRIEKTIFHSSIAAGYAGVFVGIVLAAVFDWRLIILVPISYVVGAKLGKSMYDKTILKTALCSETAFCFLYFMGQVYLLRSSDNRRFFHESP